MSLKQELQTWSDALAAFDRGDYDTALELFHSMEPGSKIYFDIGMIHATRGQHELAIEAFERSIELDPYLAVAYFQVGVSRFLLKRYGDARKDFDDACLYMRGNEIIDYEQIGLKFQLYSCEALFNRGLCLVYMNRLEKGQRDWTIAMKAKYTLEHDVINEAYLDRGQGYTVFSLAVGTVFRPPESKLTNLATRNFLGKATVVAAINPFDLHLDFYRSAKSSSTAHDALPLPDLKSNSATTLSRSRTAAARLENSGDGVARPLRRRPTLRERSAVKSQLVRSQTAPPAGGPTGSAGIESQPASELASSRSNHVEVTHSAPPTPPASLDDFEPRRRNETIYHHPLEQSAASSSSSTRDLSQPSFAEKRNRRNGLRIEVPPIPPSLSISTTSFRDAQHLTSLRSSESVSSASPRTNLVSIQSCSLRTPHLRPASLPCSSLVLSSDSSEILSRQCSHPYNTATVPRRSTRDPSTSQRDLPCRPLAGTRRLGRAPASAVALEGRLLCSSPTETVEADTDEPLVPRPAALTSYNSDAALFASSYDGTASLEHFSGGTHDSCRPCRDEAQNFTIRLRYRGQTRAMIVPFGIDVASFSERVRVKAKSSTGLSLRDNVLATVTRTGIWFRSLTKKIGAVSSIQFGSALFGISEWTCSLATPSD